MPDGQIKWLLMRAEVTLDGSGMPVRAVGVIMDISQRKHSEEHVKLLMREVNHRSKNLLAVVQSVASQGRRFREALRRTAAGPLGQP